jgi:hypothetical protein
VGYQIDEMKLESEKDGVETYRVTGWQPFEISIVSIPADNTIGVGRSTEDSKGSEVKILNQKKEAIMPKENQDVDVVTVQAEARTAERTRVRDIDAIGAKFKQTDLATSAIDDGTSADNFRAMVLEKLGSVKPVDTRATEIDMNEEEVQGYRKALNLIHTNYWRCFSC